jgi:dolichol-phosphate mannosyltransferase
MDATTPSAASPRVLVTVCTYKEKENITRLVPEIRRCLPIAHILVVDDNSPDGTADVVRQFGATDPQVHLLLRMQKEGLGAATIAGLKAGVDDGYDFLINMDADFSHPPAVLPQMLAAMDHADVSIGSRYVPGGGVKNWGYIRPIMSWGVNTYSRILLGITARDCSGAFRCYRVEKLKEIDFAKIRSKGYAFQEDFLYRCARVGCRFAEVPIIFENRVAGESKINSKEVVRALKDIALLGLDRMRGVSVR